MWKLAKHLYSTIPFTKNFKKFDLIGTTLSCQCNCVGVFYFLSVHFYFYFHFILLYNTVSVLPYIEVNQPWVYMSSQSWTPLPPPIPYHHSGSSPCTSPKHPVSCIEHRMAICFLHDSIHVAMPFSQIIPPSPSPSESKSLLYTSVSFFLSWIRKLWYIYTMEYYINF